MASSSDVPKSEASSDDDKTETSGSEQSSEFSESEEDPLTSQLVHMDEIMLQDILEHCFLPGVQLPNGPSSAVLRELVLRYVHEFPRRKRLLDVNLLDDVVRLLKLAAKVVVITGAGISVSCGIPDFRSSNGIYARLAEEYPELPEPQSLFDIHYFGIDPKPFFKFAKEIFPGNFKPSPSHHFIAALEKQGKLLRNYTQNIDALEQSAGIANLVQCHGSFLTASCTKCGHRVSCDAIRKDILDGTVPECPLCKEDTPEDSDREDEMAVMKPDIVFFGEELPHEFHSQLQEDMEQADLLIVMGSSLKVRPVALVPNLIDPKIPQILINKESLGKFNFDVELLGNSDDIVEELCYRLGEDWVKDVSFSKPCSSQGTYDQT
jgi:NAD-dependent deacetylase sirtuin 1